jgi:hypothetical protein
VVNPKRSGVDVNNVSQTEAVRGHLGRLRALANELEIEADLFEKELRDSLRSDTIPVPPPDDPRVALLSRVSEESERLCAAAVQGDFSCVHCSAHGPHEDVSSEDAVSFRCSKCGKPLGPTEIKLAVFATLARIAAEERT